MQLAIIPEHGGQALVNVQVKPASQSRALVFPSFLGHAPKPILKDDSGDHHGSSTQIQIWTYQEALQNLHLCIVGTS